MKKILLSVGFLAVVIGALSAVLLWRAAGEPVPSLGEAHQATVEQLDLERGLAYYTQIATDGNAEERLQAELALAWLDLRVHDQPEVARARLSRLIAQDKDRQEPFIMLSRIEIAQRNYDAAREAARQALERAQTRQQTRDAQIHFAWAVVEQATLSRLAPDQWAAIDFPSPALLQEALTMMRKVVETEPGELRSSRLLLATALLLDDGESALLAYRSYYWISADQELPPLLVEPYEALCDILPRWQGSQSSATDREQLVQALVGSRFFDEAALVALDPKVEGSLSTEATEVVAYARFLHDLQDEMDIYYRQVVNGGSRQTPRRIFDQAVEAFCQVVCEDPQSHGEAVVLMQDRFGAAWYFRSAGRDLFMGHIIVDQKQSVEQYGHEATFDYLRLDSLVSHGVQSWLFDRLYFVGGWADWNQIVTFRPFRVDLLLNLARPLLDSEEREWFETEMAWNSSVDRRRAAEDPYANLPGLRQRLRLKALDAIWAEAGARGLTDGEQRMHFLAVLDAVWLEGPAFAHEGRHVIDSRLGVASSVALEFNAKLAETAFCRYPGIPLSTNILHPGFGIGGHGEANRLIVQGLVAWMEAHADEIDGLDSSEPLLPQLDLLSDDQLRTAARSLDPLANPE